MNNSRQSFLGTLEQVINDRRTSAGASSYTARLFASGDERIAQKVGEEGVEIALASLTGPREKIIGEAADLLYHLLVLLSNKGISLAEVEAELEQRHQQRSR